MRAKSVWISRAGWAGAWLISLAGLTLAAGAIEPALDSLAFASPVVLVAVICTFSALMIRRGRKRPVLMSVAGVAVVLLAPTAMPEIAGLIRRSFGQPPSSSPHFKVLSVNLGQQDDVSSLLALISSEKPDVVLLAEAGETALRKLEAELGAYPTRVTCERIAYCGVSIFARAPGQLLPGGSWIADGLQKPHDLNDGLRYAAVTLDVPGVGRAPIVAVHLMRSARGGVEPDQMPRLQQKLNALPDLSAAIVAGDFNTPGWSWALARFDSAMTLNRQSFALPTWPAANRTGGLALPFTGIDHVYAGAHWRLISIQRGADIGSDHYPLITVLTPAPASP